MKHINQRDVMGWNLMAHDRCEYVHGTRPSDGKNAPEDLSSGEVAAECLAHPEWTSPSAKVRRCLAWLALNFER